MSTLLIVSTGMLLLSVAGFQHATSGAYRVDASPVGSMILVASLAVFILSLILFGVVVGMMIGGGAA